MKQIKISIFNEIMYRLLILFSVLFLSISVRAEVGQSSIPEVISAKTYLLSYAVTIDKPAESVADMKVWIPFPAETIEQTVISHSLKAPTSYQIHENSQFGNKMIFLNFDKDTTFPVQMTATYKIKRMEARLINPEESSLKSQWDPDKFLSMNKKVPINGLIAEVASEQTVGIINPDVKIRKMYEYVVDTMTYDKTGDGWGEGDAIWACTNKRGNCTDFHSLFVGMARSQKIPARFEIGLPIPPSGSGKIPGYHCWARAYSNTDGWIPFDASESKKSGKKYKYFGWLPTNRIHFTTGRDIELTPRQHGNPLNYFVYPYIELNGKVFDKFEKEFYVETI